MPPPTLGDERREVRHERDREEPRVRLEQRGEGHAPREASQELEREPDAHQPEQPQQQAPAARPHETSSARGRPNKHEAPGTADTPPGGSAHRLPGAGGLLPPFFILPPPVD